MERERERKRKNTPPRLSSVVSTHAPDYSCTVARVHEEEERTLHSLTELRRNVRKLKKKKKLLVGVLLHEELTRRVRIVHRVRHPHVRVMVRMEMPLRKRWRTLFVFSAHWNIARPPDRQRR